MIFGLLFALAVGDLTDSSAGPGTLFRAMPVGGTEYVMGLDEAGFSTEPGTVFIGGVERVRLSSVRWIGGPKPARRPSYVYLTMASSRMHWRRPILVMTRADGPANSFNDPHHATEHWRDIDDGVCLDDATVAEWKIGAFYDALDKNGVRCPLKPKTAH